MSYEKEWNNYKRRWIWLVVIFVTYLPGVGGLSKVFRLSEGMTLLLAILWMCAFMIAGLRVWLWFCPKCQDIYHYSFPFWNPLARECMHCGMKKNEMTGHKEDV